MDGAQFDALAKSFITQMSRRRTLAALLAGALGLTSSLGVEDIAAKSCTKQCQKQKDCKDKNDKKAKRKCKKACKKKCKRGPFCAGKNSCQAGNSISTCQQAGAEQCVCVASANDGAPFCALNSPTFPDDCSATPCPVGQTCVNLNGGDCPGGFKCAAPCPQPL